MGKVCSKCKIEKDFCDFYKDKNKKDGLDIWCKECRKDYDKSRSEQRKEYIKKYREEHKAENTEYHKNYIQNEENLRRIHGYQKQHYIENKEKLNAKHRDYYREHKEEFIARQKKYRKENQEVVRERRRNYVNNKRKEDQAYRIRGNVSSAIYKALKRNNSSRHGKSYFNKLSYTAEDLRQHLESLFETWMNWDNYGPHTPEKRTWQIDHITPQSALPYTSPEDDNFHKCWTLENLRPLESMENIKKSNKELENIKKYSQVMENIKKSNRLETDEPSIEIFVKSKVCYKCNTEKDRSEFGIRNSSIDGLNGLCKECKRVEDMKNYYKRTQSNKAKSEP